MDLQGSRALVAGATGELGARLARARSAQGARVAIAGRDRARREALAAELRAPGIALELRDVASVRSCVEQAAELLRACARRYATGAARSRDADEVVGRILDAVRRDRRELHWDLKSNRLVTD